MGDSPSTGHRAGGPGFVSSRKPRRAGRRASCRPRVEALEDRALPSTFTVTNTNDSGTGSLRQAIADSSGAGVGIRLEQAGGNRVENCFLGTDPAGTHSLSRGGDGLDILTGSDGNTIGGTAAGTANLISGNAGVGLSAASNGNLVEG